MSRDRRVPPSRPARLPKIVYVVRYRLRYLDVANFRVTRGSYHIRARIFLCLTKRLRNENEKIKMRNLEREIIAGRNLIFALTMKQPLLTVRRDCLHLISGFAC